MTVAAVTFVLAGLLPWQVLDRKMSVVRLEQRLWALVRLSVPHPPATLHLALALTNPDLLQRYLLLSLRIP